MMLRHARVIARSLARWQRTASASGWGSTAVRLSRKTSIASRTARTPSIYDPGKRLLLGPAGTIRRHERIPVVLRRNERLLDRPRADPADEVPHRAGLVVRARRARAAEGLLADDGARRLVVDVEVPGGVPELRVRFLDGEAVVGEDGAGQAVRRRRVDEIGGLAPALVVVDEGRDDGPEQLLAHRPVAGILGLDHRRRDEVPVAVVVLAADHDLRRRGRARLVARLLL